MNYVGQIWRPPSEARSCILQVTVGCSHNQCTFCVMYKEKDFYTKSMDEIRAEIKEVAQQYPEQRRVFLADGDALRMPTADLLEILQLLDQSFPKLTRVTTYAGPTSIIEKTVAELHQLKEAGLKMAYLGLESGSREILQRVKKGATPEMMIEAGKKLREAGIKSSVTVILGLGGQELSQLHARETAKVVNQMNPNYLSALTLMISPEMPLHQEIESGQFQLLDSYQALEELYQMLTEIQVTEPCIFRSNHASNYIAVNGTLPKDREKMLADLQEVLEHPEEYLLKAEWMRGL